MIFTLGMTIVTSVFPPEKRGRALGIIIAAVYVGLSVGPLIGGSSRTISGGGASSCRTWSSASSSLLRPCGN
jgi:MFS family permease